MVVEVVPYQLFRQCRLHMTRSVVQPMIASSLLDRCPSLVHSFLKNVLDYIYRIRLILPGDARVIL